MSSPAKIAMIAITTSSSTSVKAQVPRRSVRRPPPDAFVLMLFGQRLEKTVTQR
jgi:hypothetical protein